MPMLVLKKEDEIIAYEADHPEVPPLLWEFVNHELRVIRAWARVELCVDIVVWCEDTNSYRLVQDICFRDAYSSADEWHKAVHQLFVSSTNAYVITHADN